MSEPEFLPPDEPFYPEFLTQAQSLWKRQMFERATPLDWGGMILRPEFDCYRVGEAIDCMNGVYGLFDSLGGLLYIGMSSNIPYRMSTHRKAGVIHFAEFSFVPVPHWACEEVEIAHIHALEPDYNSLYKPHSWSGCNQMIAAIRQLWGPKR